MNRSIRHRTHVPPSLWRGLRYAFVADAAIVLLVLLCAKVARCEPSHHASLCTAAHSNVLIPAAFVLLGLALAYLSHFNASPDDEESCDEQDYDDCTHQIAEALNRAAGWLDMPEGDRP